jgi:cation diffusion facilitator family transporter
MLASLADSGLDLAASLLTLGAVIYAAEPPDEEHRYGHGKAEGFAALIQAALVGASAALIAREAIGRLIDPKPVDASELSIIVMLVSILLTLGLVYFQSRALKQTGSVATEGDRAHYMADLGANFAVIVAIISSTYLGIPVLDPIIGLGIAIWLAYGAIEVASKAFDQLMDKELEEGARARIRELAVGDESDLTLHELRTRAAGPLIHIQFHLEMPNTLSLQEAHKLMVGCEERILAEFPGADILIHPDPKGVADHGSPFFNEGLEKPKV